MGEFVEKVLIELIDDEGDDVLMEVMYFSFFQDQDGYLYFVFSQGVICYS